MNFNHKSFSIGVEIEMTGLSRMAAANHIADFFGSSVEFVGGKTDIYEIRDESNRSWRIESDESIQAQRINKKGEIVRASEEYKVELVSPVLNYNGISLLQEIVQELRLYGKAIVNTSTGIHIHIGAHMFTPQKIINLCNIVNSKQNLIEKALLYSHRKRFCDEIPEVIIERLNKLKPQTITDLGDIWYETPYQYDYSRGNYYHHTRYRMLNLHQFLSQRQKTIEFRMFNGTLDIEILLGYIQFSTLIAAQALNQTRAVYKRTDPNLGNDKYAFRIWLIKMGAIGEEYKYMRSYLLKHLQGNSAWA